MMPGFLFLWMSVTFFMPSCRLNKLCRLLRWHNYFLVSTEHHVSLGLFDCVSNSSMKLWILFRIERYRLSILFLHAENILCRYLLLGLWFLTIAFLKNFGICIFVWKVDQLLSNYHNPQHFGYEEWKQVMGENFCDYNLQRWVLLINFIT